MRESQKIQVSKLTAHPLHLLVVGIMCLNIIFFTSCNHLPLTQPQCKMPTGQVYTNFIGMKLVRIQPGHFAMGFGDKLLPEKLVTAKGQFVNGDFDEHPTHKVEITKPFFIGMYEVTNAQYELFDQEYKKLRGKGTLSKDDDEAVVNVNWYEARAFCRWLSDKEGLPYRLPTEAEWEYACRAGTTTHYHTGEALSKGFSEKSKVSLEVGQTPPNPWGVYDMHGNVEEWCHDWYGPYEAGKQVDPVGRVCGDFRVTRGGSHSTELYYLRSANRLGTVPEDKHSMIGFRVVLGEMPMTEPLPEPPPELYQTSVSQETPPDIDQGPNPNKPFFYGPRLFIKMPAGNRGPLFSKHNHFTSVVECPNGDLLAIWHTCIGESGRELAVAGSRLRYGREQWEPASVFWDTPDRNDHGHALWFDGNKTVYHFNGIATRSRNVALMMRTSIDNGVTWSRPRLIADHGPSRMPVESIFRTKEGFYVLSCDKGPNVVWISRNQGLTWDKSVASIRGKHAPVVQLKDGRLMAFGREGNIDGKMPISISGDMGKSWEYLPSDFQPVSWGQRAVVLRLKERPLFFASFCKRMMITDASGKRRPVSGLFGAVSLDEGKSWANRRLVTDDGPGRDIETMDGYPVTMDTYNTESAGYLSVCQSADGVIHLLSSRQHYAFNLKWVMTPPPAAPVSPPLPQARRLPARRNLANIYKPDKSPTKDNWGWRIRDSEESQVMGVSAKGPLRIQTEVGRQFWLRSDHTNGFINVDPKKGFTAEIRTQVLKSTPNERGIDLELYDGASSRYAITITDSSVYWYEGLVLGSAMLDFEQFTPVAEGVDNADAMHVYRLAVRGDRVAQIYRDGKLIGIRRAEYRTPREAYIQFGAGRGAEALVDYVAYDLNGPSRP